MKQRPSSSEIPQEIGKAPESTVSIAAKIEASLGTPDNFQTKLYKYSGMSEQMRAKAIQNDEAVLEAKSNEISQAISQIDAQIKPLHPSKDAGQRIALGAQRRALENLQTRIDGMLLKLDETLSTNVADTLETVDPAEMAKTTEMPRIRINKTPEQKTILRDSLSPFFDDMLPERKVDGVTYGEFSSATAAESEKSHFAKELNTDIGNVFILTNTGGEKSKYQSNEDATFAISEKDRVVVGSIDGMGGGGNGKIAGRIVSSVFEKNLRANSGVAAFEDCRDEIIEQFKNNPLVAGKSAGACGVVAEITKSNDDSYDVTAMYAGDSKMLTIQDGIELEAGTTKSQNVVSEGLEEHFRRTGVDERHEYFAHPMSNQITGSFTANRSQKLPEIVSFKAKAGARSIIASDGLWDNVSHYEVIKLSEELPDDEAFQAALFSLAMERNNSAGTKFDIAYAEGKTTPKKLKAGDNITIAVVRYGKELVPKNEVSTFRKPTEKTREEAKFKTLEPEPTKPEPLSPTELSTLRQLEDLVTNLETKNAELDQSRREQRLALSTALEDEKKALVERQMYMKPWQRWIRLDFRSDKKFDAIGADLIQKIKNLDENDAGLRKINELINQNTAQINQVRKEIDVLRRRAQANKQ